MPKSDPLSPPYADLRNPVGTHVQVGAGLVKGALAHADLLGCETIQVFVGNPRGWAHSAGDPAVDAAFRAGLEARGMRAFVHAPYLVNLGSPTLSTYQKSVASVAHNLRRAAEIGAEGVVVHTGSFVEQGAEPGRYDAAMRQVREGLLPLLDTLEAPGAPTLLLEPTAGQGRSLCAGVDDLEPYLAVLDDHPRAGICLDTCHVFAAGAPLDEPGGTTATLDRLVEIGGPGRLGLVHANDSMDVRGAFKDRHERIGEGHIGQASFEELLAHDVAGRRTRHPGDSRVPRRRRSPDRAAQEAAAVRGLIERRTSLVAALALLGVTAAWGSTFFLTKDLLDRVPVLDFLAVRFAIATLAVVVLFPRALSRLSARSRRSAVILGGLYGVAQILQTAGLAHTPASVSGFITGLYVVATPIFAAVLLHQRIGRLTWGAVALALAGLAVLTLSGAGAGLGIGYGESLTFASALLYALHIVGLGAWSTSHEAMGMTIIQLGVITIICFVATVPDGIVLPATGADWLSVVYMALVAGALAMAAQTWAQAHLPPTRTAIIMSMEPVFAAFFAVLLGGESLTARMLVGGSMVLAAMLVVELVPRRKFEAEVTHISV